MKPKFLSSSSSFPPFLKGGIKKGVLILSLVICYLEFPKFFNSKILAQHFESDSFVIDWGNFNMTSGSKNSTTYKLTDTVGQIAPGQYSKNGYVIKSGFQYIYDTFTPFSFIIDNLAINFGTLVPEIGTTAANTITITSPYGRGYQIMVAENHPLQINPSLQIPDTTCDSGPCSESSPGPWILSTTHGFGFNAIGINNSGVATNVGTSGYFGDGTYFRQFANISARETPQIIMSENSSVKNRSARITYKVNITALQAAGNYENAINFIAIPKY